MERRYLRVCVCSGSVIDGQKKDARAAEGEERVRVENGIVDR
jgi:hypothetical protein